MLTTRLFFLMMLSPYYLQSQVTSLQVESKYSKGLNRVNQIASPFTEAAILNLIFVLSVEAAKKHYQYGNGLAICQQLIEKGQIADDVVFIQPDYPETPWYGDHPTDTTRWQLTYTAELIRQEQSNYPDRQLKTYLLGFSKSGFGSVTILRKHPELIDGILIWDAPLSTQWNDGWDMHFAFDSENHFMANYYLMGMPPQDFNAFQNKKIVVGGYDFFKKQSSEFLSLLEKNKIDFVHDQSLNFPHKWDKTWIIQLLSHIDSLISP